MELLAGALGVAVAACAVLAGQRAGERRRLAARLVDLASQLGTPAPASAGPAPDLAAALSRMSRAVGSATVEGERARGLLASLSGALGSLDLGVVVVARSDQVLFRNDAAASLVGTRHGDTLASQAMSELIEGARSGGPRSRTIELFGPPRRTLSLSAALVDEGSGTVAVIVEDVSDRRRLDAVRRDFVANVSHELKTPVAALGLLAETLTAEDDLGVVRRLAERMNTEAFRVARIIEDLLDLSRLESELAHSHERVAVVQVVAQAVDHVRAQAGLADVEIKVSAVPSSWSVTGDRRQLVSAVANLLENAVKYSDAGSSVEVSARTDGQTIEVVVEDHGIGIPSRDLDRIFERFYRVDRGRGRDTGGTGLGLSIVRHVATNHGGDVVVESHEGEGSVFTLRLPAEARPMGMLAEAG